MSPENFIYYFLGVAKGNRSDYNNRPNQELWDAIVKTAEDVVAKTSGESPITVRHHSTIDRSQPTPVPARNSAYDAPLVEPVDEIPFSEPDDKIPY